MSQDFKVPERYEPRSVIIERITLATRDQRQQIAEALGLKIDLDRMDGMDRAVEAAETTVQAAQAAVTEATAALTAAIDVRIDALNALGREAEAAAAAYTPELEVGFIDEAFAKQALSSGVSERAALLKAARGEPLSYDENRFINSLPDRTRDRSTQVRFQNVLRLVYDGQGRVNAVRGNSYTFSIPRAKALAEWAIAYWREPRSRASTKQVQHDGGRYSASVDVRAVTIGCQRLDRLEITRIAYLMGWGGFEPHLPPERLPKPPAKRVAKPKAAPTASSRARKAVAPRRRARVGGF